VTAASVRFGGTPAYASPENFQEELPLTYASDIWSLAAMLYEMASGSPPFGRIKDPVAAGTAIAGDMDEADPVAAGTAIAGNMDEAVTDIRDAAPEDIRANLSESFAMVLGRGLQ
ncbi:hypothetical protein T484DRAFT_1865098, partial [Baffinella frigidus]